MSKQSGASGAGVQVLQIMFLPSAVLPSWRSCWNLAAEDGVSCHKENARGPPTLVTWSSELSGPWLPLTLDCRS